MERIALLAAVVVGILMLVHAPDVPGTTGSNAPEAPDYGPVDGIVDIQQVDGEIGEGMYLDVVVERSADVNRSEVSFDSYELLLKQNGSVLARANVGAGGKIAFGCPSAGMTATCALRDALRVRLSYNGTITGAAYLELWEPKTEEVRDAADLAIKEEPAYTRVTMQE